MTAIARLAVIGTGHWGRNLARNFHALGALAAFAEPHEARRAEVAALYPDANAHDDTAQVLGDDTIDAVAIAAPAAVHGALVAEALDAGKHVFVEKPLCLDIAEGQGLARQADAAGRVLMVGHLLLYHPAFQALRAMVAAGGIGNIRYIYANRLSLGQIRRVENALWSFAPHDVSMILSLVGEMPARIMASGGTYLSPEVADTTLSHLSFGEGVQAHIFVSWLHPYKDHRMVVVGSDGMLVFDDVKQGLEKLLHYPHGVGWRDDLPNIDKAEAHPVAYEAEEPLKRECAHFLDCVANGARPLSDAGEGLRVLTVLDACQRSLASGEPTTVDGGCFK